MIWFYSKNGQQLGPISEQDFSNKCSSGEILGTDLVWKEGMPDWIPMSQVTGLSLSQKISQPPAVVMPPQSGVGNVMSVQPPPVDVRFIPQRIPNYQWQSIAALVLSCLQMLLCCIPVGLIFAIIAMVYSNKVEPYFMQQNYLAAEDASRSAKIWMIVSFSVTGLFILGGIGMMVIAILNP